MRKQFAEYYKLSSKEYEDIWNNALIVFDTNVLLNLYRYNEEARNEFLKVIKFYKERLWIPYQIGLEFHKCREDIIRRNVDAYRLLGNCISEQLVRVVENLSSERDYVRHPYINLKEIKKKVERCTLSIKKSLEKQSKEHPDYSKDDNILKTITNLYNTRVGEDFKEEDLETLYKEGEKRYANKIPPGYCDEKNKKDKEKRSLYGDLIVWKQTISQSKDKGKDIIFVTDDYKSDWWDKIEGKHSPRKELIKEFVDNTGQNILIYNSSRFLEYAKQNKEVKVSQKTINDVLKVANAYRNWRETYSKSQEVIYGFNFNKEYWNNLIKYNALFPLNLKHSPYFKDILKTIQDSGGIDNINKYSHIVEQLPSSVNYQDLKEKIDLLNASEKSNLSE